MKISRRTFVILLILLISFLLILTFTLIVGMLSMLTSTELTFSTSNTEFTEWHLPDGAKARLGKGIINDIEFTPDGTRFYVATTIGVWEYDAKTGKELSLSKGERENILHIVFSTDGQELIGINRDNYMTNVKQWNTRNWDLISSIQDIGRINENGKRKYISTSDFSKKGLRFGCIGSSRENEINLWTITDEIHPPRHSNIKLNPNSKIGRAITISSDGRYIATTMLEKDSNSIFIWNADTGEHLDTLVGNKGRIVDLAFSPDGTILASGDIDEIVTLWDLKADVSNQIYKGTFSTSFIFAFSPDSKLLAYGDGRGKVRIFKVNEKENGIAKLNGQAKFELRNRGHKNKVSSLAFSPDGKILISGSEDGTIRGADVVSGKFLFLIPGHTVKAAGVAELTEEGRLLSFHSMDRQLSRWDIGTGTQLSSIYLSAMSTETMSYDGKTLVVEEWLSFSKNKFKMWNIRKRKSQAVLKGHLYSTTANPDYVFSIDGKLLASTDFYDLEGNILLWDLGNSRRSFLQTILFRLKSIPLTHTLSGHTDRVNTIVFAPNGKMLASHGSDKKLCLWNVKTGKNIFTQPDVRVSGNALAFSNNSNVLASGSSNRIVLWDSTTGERINQTRTNENVNTLLFSQDSKILLSGTSRSGSIQLFDTATLQLRSTHSGHSDDVSSLILLADGRTLVSVSEDGTMLLWDWNKLLQMRSQQ